MSSSWVLMGSPTRMFPESLNVLLCVEGVAPGYCLLCGRCLSSSVVRQYCFAAQDTFNWRRGMGEFLIGAFFAHDFANCFLVVNQTMKAVSDPFSLLPSLLLSLIWLSLLFFFFPSLSSYSKSFPLLHSALSLFPSLLSHFSFHPPSPSLSHILIIISLPPSLPLSLSLSSYTFSFTLPCLFPLPPPPPPPPPIPLSLTLTFSLYTTRSCTINFTRSSIATRLD